MRFPPIAIVGRACVLPGALTPEELWTAVLEGRDLITSAPKGLWRLPLDRALVSPEDPSSDRTWSDRGGYIRGFREKFDPTGFAITPESLEGLDEIFLWSIHTAREALRDSGDTRTGIVDRPRVAAIFGNLGFPTDRMAAQGESFWLDHSPAPDPRNRFMSSGPASLIQQALGLGGGAYCLDAACASSLHAIKLACDKLHTESADLVLAGAVQGADDLFLHIGFCALNAMSRSGRSRPFHRGADGLVPAQGAGFVALKRLADARRDGDRIHGLIRGVGLSNDGRGKGLLAPAREGQERALRQAYHLADIDPIQVSLLECHATGTPVGDSTELESTAAVFSKSADVPIGSLKSNLGHLITTAGVAGLIKVLEAMRAGIRPPTLHVEEPTEALDGTPFRLLREAESWTSNGVRIAGVSAFGFGGNNAHLIVSEDAPDLPLTPIAPVVREPVVVVGIGTMVGRATNRTEVTDIILNGKSLVEPRSNDGVAARMDHFDLDLEGLRFPPRDLEQALPQQIASLRVAREAMAEAGPLPRDRTSVTIAMEPDAEITRHGTRWRLGNWTREPGSDASWLSRARDALARPLEAAGVVGTMPNVPASRISSQFDLGGPSFSLSAGEPSGLLAMELAIESLSRNEIDAAVVGAVDFSCEPIHESAARVLLDPSRQIPGDAAVVLVLKRLADARRDGNRIYGIVTTDETVETGLSLGFEPGCMDLTSRLGHAFAASGLVHVTAALLAVHHRQQLDGAPWLHAGCEPRSARVCIPGGPPVLVTEDRASYRVGEIPVPRLHIYRGLDRSDILRRLQSSSTGGSGPCCLVIVARPDQLEQREERATALIELGRPAGAGVHLRDGPLDGDLAFVFTGAGAAYHGMGRELLGVFPELSDRLQLKSEILPKSLARAWGDSAERLSELDHLWGSSALCQLHADLTRNVLKLRPDAAIGYSSGETNALMALEVWKDIDQMIEDSESSNLFTGKIGGTFDAVARLWGRPVQWSTWRVLVPLDLVMEAIDDLPNVHLAIIHSDTDHVIAGDAAGCERALDRLGRSKAARLHYDLAVHVPELDAVREPWLDLHRRNVFPVDGVRIYGNATGAPYIPDRESCAQAILGQANRSLDFRPTIERSYKDGVRIFVEHGPQAACSAWIRQILGTRDAVIVSLDRKGQGIECLLDSVAALVAAGVNIDHEALERRLITAPSIHGPASPASRCLTFSAHPPPVRFPEAFSSEAGSATAPEATQPTHMVHVVQMVHMVQAPALPPILGPDWRFVEPREISTVVRPEEKHPAPAALPLAQDAGFEMGGFAPSPPSAPPVLPATVLDRYQEHIRHLSRVHQEFLSQQDALHQNFLMLRQETVENLLRVAGATAYQEISRTSPPPVAGQMLASSPPRLAPVDPHPVTRRDPPTHPTVTARSPSGREQPPGPTFDRKQMQIHASGRISDIFGENFRSQDLFPRQVRMPEPPLLLADRVTWLDAEAGSMKTGSIGTETDVRWDSWFLHQGHMPPGILIESGQADLMLISYLGIDLLNRNDRVYRLLGCELTFHGNLPRAGDTLRYDIHVDGYAAQGDVRLFFFHYDCHAGERPQLTVRSGQAGFFTDQELAGSAGCLWKAEDQEIHPGGRVDPPAVACRRSSFDRHQIGAFSRGDTFECFGPGFETAQAHVRSPRISDGQMLLVDQVTRFDPAGGPWKRGYLRAELELSPSSWFFEGHFKNDPCMPGTLMFEGCMQAMAIYLAGMGYTLSRDGWRFQPVPELPYSLSCRGQATPTSKQLLYEVFVEEVHAGPVPTLHADLLCTVDGMKAFHARKLAIQLVPDWPLCGQQPELLPLETSSNVAEVDGFRFDERSLQACAWGRPSEAFGPMYQVFDGPRTVARLPGPPYHFVTRIKEVVGEMGVMQSGAHLEAEYDIPDDAWYFDQNGFRSMPFAVLMEAALQPCGWLASYVGSALSVPGDLGFRNLDGTGTLHGEVFPDSGTLSTRAELKSISATAGMIIESFDVECRIGDRCIYEMSTVFGFFPAAALANQVGLPATDEDRDLFSRRSDFEKDLTTPLLASDTSGERRPELAGPMLLMLDRITGYWPKGGEAGLGQMRAEKKVDPAEWFFKAHFFQDPVQPGSLGIEAMLQLLQAFMLEKGLDAGVPDPRFEPLSRKQEIRWKYRGQVLPHNQTIVSTLEVTGVGRDETGVFAVARACLWVDGSKIYEATDIGMRIVSGLGPEAPPAEWILSPAETPWILDHCPTWTVPALPMMVMVDVLAQGARGPEPVVALEDVRVKGWLVVDRLRRLRVEKSGDRYRLLSYPINGGEPDSHLGASHLGIAVTEIASARVLTGQYGTPPDRLPSLDGEDSPSPYASGALFHGPSMQVMQSHILGKTGASSILDAQNGVPPGCLNPGLLDGATHAIPHDSLHVWNEKLSPDKVAYPALIPRIDFYGPTPTTGSVTCEVRCSGFMGNRDFPTFEIQLATTTGVWAELQLVEACFPKGTLGAAPSESRRAFLRDQLPIPGLSLSTHEAETTSLELALVEESDWLPGTVSGIYGTRDPVEIAIREHRAAAHGLHPARVTAQLPLTRFEDPAIDHRPGQVVITGDRTGRLDIAIVRDFWDRWFDRARWPVQDIYYGLIDRFIGRIVLEDPAGFEALRGRSVLYLANHQTGIESLLFSIVASALNGVPTITLAKIEHRESWLGRLIQLCFSYPDVVDPEVMMFFDREDKDSLVRIIGQLGAQMAGPGRSVMVHVEGTRALSARHAVSLMSGAFIDMALSVGAAIVPVRFIGGLPVKPLETRTEYPIGMGRQDVWLGRPLQPEQLKPLHYGARKDQIIEGINRLGIPNDQEVPLQGDPEFSNRVRERVSRTGVRHEWAVLWTLLEDLPDPSPGIHDLLNRVGSGALPWESDPESQWFARLEHLLMEG